MDPKKFQAMQVKVDGARGIAITTTQIHPEYSLKYDPDVDATTTAHVVLFSVLPSASGRPAFRGRWDDKAGSVDVDLDGSWNQRHAFKWSLPGYSGHHTSLLAASPRKYGIDIRIPGVHVFQGEITLGINIAVRLEDALGFKAEVAMSVAVVKPNPIRRIIRWLRALF